jgi:predicted O-linked N-acetylglucosamine transferase (SPINDLY family)
MSVAKRDQRLQIERELKFRRALDFHRKGDLTEAEAICRAIARKAPADFNAAWLLSVIYLQTGRFDRAIAAADAAIAAQPNAGLAYINKGIALEQSRRFADAVDAYDKAIVLLPDSVEAWCNRGIALHQVGRYEDARASLEKASGLNPALPEPWSNLGLALDALGRPEDALACHEKAIARRPGQAELHLNRGRSLNGLNRVTEAIASFDKALALRPDFAEAWSSRGNALRRLKRLEDAAASHDKAVRFAPDDADAWFNRGLVMTDLKRFDAALVSHETALRLRPDFASLPGTIWETRAMMCDWTDWDARTAALCARIERGERAAPPFTMLAASDAPAIQLAAARMWNADTVAPETPLNRTPNPKPRIAYVSADFRDHATTWLISGLIDRHDRDRFEIVAYSFGGGADTPMGRRMRAAFDRFIDVTDLSDEAIAARMRADGIDIAVDLNGYTAGSRPGVFAHRAAPVQVNFLCYPGTMGVPYFDYIVADPTILPETMRPFFTEKVVWLPHTYQPNDRTRVIAPTEIRRADLGLPEDGFVFCCLNNNYKITPDVFRLWMTILLTVQRSVLWLLDDNPWALANLRAAAAGHGVDPARLIFAPRLPMAEHLARQRAAGLFLDTLPVTAHTTASDALWAGLPVLTRIGTTFVGRVAASLVRAAGLPELVVETADEYVALACDLAHDRPRLDAIRARLAANRLTCPLFDTDGYTRHLEAAYTAMLDRLAAGMAPDHIVIPA